MAIEKIIFQRITRWQEEQGSELKLSDHCPTVTADYESLFSQLKKVFNNKPGKEFGYFDEDYANHPFQSWLTENLNQKLAFESLAAKVMESFKLKLDATPLTFEGHFCFISETRADGNRFYVFVLDTLSGMRLDNSLELDIIDTLNTSRLDLALRIDLEDWQSETSKQENLYCCLLKSRNQTQIGELFSQSLGFKNGADTAQETETLMAILNKYTRESEPKEAAALNQKTYDYCVEQQQLGDSVELAALSGYLDENQPTRFAQFATEETQLADAARLHPDTRKLKHLIRLSGKGHGISLSFSSDLIQQTVLYDEQQDTLTITAIPKTLKKQLLEVIKGPQES